MGIDLRKISIRTWIILAGVFLYMASLWQRPLFISEFSFGSGAAEALHNGTLPPAPEALFYLISKYLGTFPLAFRLIPALLTLLCAGALYLAGRKSRFSGAANAGPLIFLLTPSVFLCGTTAFDFVCKSAPVITGLCLLFLFAESASWRKSLLAGVGAGAALSISLCIWGGVTHFLFALGAWIIYCIFSLFFKDPEAEKPPVVKLLLSLLPFVPGALLHSQALPGAALQLPHINNMRTLAAFAAAGSFPWIVFLPAVLRNFSSRLMALIHDRFTLWGLILCLSSLVMALFVPVSCGFFLIFPAGLAVLLGGGMEMEYTENGPRALNVVLFILAIIFFLCALALGSYAALGLYTSTLKSGWKIFTAKDAWILTALVPAVTGIWCITGAGEKVYKERKFLALCAGTAFLLLAFHGLVPLKVVENNAPVKFLEQAVRTRMKKNTVIYCSKELFTPAKNVLKNATVKYLLTAEEMAELNFSVKAGKSICVLTSSRQLSDSLPFPKTTLRSGRFSAVFYNIDFPEMRVRKP